MKSTRVSRRPRTAMAGFSLLEVMVSIFIVAIGLLGLAGLQARTLLESASASQRSVATAQAANLADLMRANRMATDKGLFNVREPGKHQVQGACFEDAGCSVEQMAESTLANWNASNARLLPGGSGTVCVDSTPNDGNPAKFECDDVSGAPLVIKVWWNDDRNPDPASYRRFVTATNP